MERFPPPWPSRYASRTPTAPRSRCATNSGACSRAPTSPTPCASRSSCRRAFEDGSRRISSASPRRRPGCWTESFAYGARQLAHGPPDPPDPRLRLAPGLPQAGTGARRLRGRGPDRFARRLDRAAPRSQSRLGAFLDPTADKLLLTASFVTLTYLKVLPFWIAVVVISRDVILVVGTLLVYMLGARVYPRPTWAGKAATFFQILTVLTGLLARFLHVPIVPRFVLWLAAAFTVISGLQYLVQGMKFLSAAPGAARDPAHDDASVR